MTTISKILNHSSHQPLGLPSSSWRFYQEWNKALFLHWKVDQELLRPFLPNSVEIELIENEAWISIVAFSMEKVRLRFLPAFPPISNFHEVNIRTYVKTEKSSGVYFLSIEAGNRISSAISRSLSGFPYRYSKMSRNDGLFNSNNVTQGESFKTSFGLGDLHVHSDKLDECLLERYFAFQEQDGTLNKYQIHHLPWKTRKLKLNSLEIDYPRFNSLFEGQPDRSHYSDGVQILAWNKIRAEL